MTPLVDEPKKVPLWQQLFKPGRQEKHGQFNSLAKLLIISALLIGTSGVLMDLFDHLHHTEQNANAINHRSLVMLNELHDLHSQLQQLANNTNNPTNIRHAVSSLTSELESIEKIVSDNAKTTDVKKISDQLIAVQADLADFEKNIAAQFSTKKYMEAKTLPFQVNELDMISGQPFASVDYDHHVTPIGIGDSLSGWTLSAADYSGQTVEFSNSRGQYVKINLVSAS